MAQKNKRIKLSFEDEEEEEVTIFTKKRPAAATKTSRIIQAPVVSSSAKTISVDPLTSVESASSNTTQSYSKADLTALRSAQNFAAKSVDVEMDVDVIELSGDQAEALEEQLYGSGDAVKDHSYDAVAAESKRKRDAQRMSKSSGRIWTSDLMRKNDSKRVAFDSELDVDVTEWEGEAMSRGVLQPAAIRDEELSRMRLGFQSTRSGSRSTAAHEVMLQDLIELVRANVDKLQEQLVDHDRSMERCRAEEALAATKAKDFDDVAERSYQRLHAVEEAKRFFPNIVGMLRDKEPLLRELLAAWRTCLQRQKDQRRLAMLTHQEDLVFRVKQAGELIVLGDYRPVPNGVLMTSSQNDAVDDFGRLKPVAMVNGKAFYTHTEALAARQTQLYGALQTHLLIDTTDELQAQALQRQRWELLPQPSNAVDNNTLCVYLDALMHCVAPNDWVHAWQRDVDQVDLALTALMEDVAYEVMNVSEIFQVAAHLRSRLPDAYYEAYIPLSLAQVVEQLAILETLAHTKLFFHPREVVGTRDRRDEQREDVVGGLSHWRWTKQLLAFIGQAPPTLTLGSAKGPHDSAPSRRRVLAEANLEDDVVLFQQVLRADSLVWETYFAAFFDEALDFTCARSCHHAAVHFLHELFALLLPAVHRAACGADGGAVNGASDVAGASAAAAAVRDGAWSVFVHQLQDRVVTHLLRRWEAQLMELCFPVCIVHVVPPVAHLRRSNGTAPSSSSSSVSASAASGTTAEAAAAVAVVPAASITATATAATATTVASGASNFKGGRMMFVSASKPPAESTSGGSSSSNSAPVAAPVSTSAHRDPSTSTSTSHSHSHSHGSHRAGLGYSSAAATSTATTTAAAAAASGGTGENTSAAVTATASSVTTEDVFTRDYGLGVSLMALQAQRAAQMLAHATQYFVRPYWLFLEAHGGAGGTAAAETAAAPSTIRSKRAQLVRETCRRALWQRSEPMLRKLARVSHTMAFSAALAVIEQLVHLLQELLPYCHTATSPVNLPAWERCRDRVASLRDRSRTVSATVASSSEWKTRGDDLVLVLDDLSVLW